MFARVMVFIICLFFVWCVQRSKHWSGGEVRRHMSLSLRNLVPTPMLSLSLSLYLSHTLTSPASFFDFGTLHSTENLYRRETPVLKTIKAPPPTILTISLIGHIIRLFSSPLGTSLFLHICTLDVSVYFIHY
jgi:hypothetical protein